MTHATKTRTGTLDDIAAGSHVFNIIAMDQRNTLRRMFTAVGLDAGDDDLRTAKADVARVLTPAASGLLSDPTYGVPAVMETGALAPGCGLLVTAEPSERRSYQGELRTHRDPALDARWVLDQGGDALKFFVQMRADRPAPGPGEPDLVAEALAVCTEIIRDCRAAGVPVLIENLVYARPGEDLSGQAREDAIIERAAGASPETSARWRPLGCGLSQGTPASRFGKAAVTHALPVAAHVIDAAGDVERRQQRTGGVLGVQRGPEGRARMVFPGARAVEKPEAQDHTAPDGRKPGGLLFGGQRGTQDDRNLPHRCLLRHRPAAGIDERDSRLDIDFDLGSQRRVHQNGGRLGPQPVVLAPRLRLLHAVQRLDARGQMKHRIHVTHGRTHGERVEQVEPTASGSPHVMPGGLSDRHERPAKNTCSPSDEHPHEISFPGWRRTSSRSPGRWAARVGAAYPACGRGGPADIGQLADVAAGGPGAVWGGWRSCFPSTASTLPSASSG
jgi:hypothetical protein